MNPNDYDNDGNNIVPCPICLCNYNPCKHGGKCPEEDEFVREMSVAKIVEEFLTNFPPIWTLPELTGRIEDQIEMERRQTLALYEREKTAKWLRTTLTQKLQKARHNWLREEIVKLEGMTRNCCAGIGPCDEICRATNEGNHIIQTIIDRYQEELDQPTV